MGGRQSRVETSENHQQEPEQVDKPPTISVTPSLVENLNEQARAKRQAQHAQHHPQQQQQHHHHQQQQQQQQQQVMRPDMEAVIQKRLQEAYSRGVEAGRKQAGQKVKEFQQMEQARVQERVHKIVEQLEKKTFRAPLNEVRCSPEREECMKCYRENGSDVLKCKEVAEAFLQCAQDTTEEFVKQ